MPEAGQNSRENERYKAAWNAYGMRRGLIFALLGVFLLVGLALDRWVRLDSTALMGVIGAGGVLLIASFAFLHAFRCPCCGENFYKGQKRTRACQSCGLRLNEIPGETP